MTHPDRYPPLTPDRGGNVFVSCLGVSFFVFVMMVAAIIAAVVIR